MEITKKDISVIEINQLVIFVDDDDNEDDGPKLVNYILKYEKNDQLKISRKNVQLKTINWIKDEDGGLIISKFNWPFLPVWPRENKLNLFIYLNQLNPDN